MNELLECIAIVLAAVGGFVVLPLGTRPVSDRLYAAWMGLAAIFGLAGAVRVLLGRETAGLLGTWAVPGGAFDVQVDALSATFLLSIFLLGALGAVYAIGYFSVAVHGKRALRLRLYYGLIVAGMALLVIAKNSLLFLAGWEVMALSAFMALSVEDHRAPVREASLVYLVATRLGTLAIIGCFALLRASTGGFSLALSGLDSSSPLAAPIFLCALLGFGIKAGIMPLHIWLPSAHANAPTHVSALMSGVLIKMGIYGVLRLTSFFETIPVWWGLLIFGLGLVSSLLGVAFALGQHDLKRLLAYHSVENIGIILLGIAIGLIGRAKGEPGLVLLGFGGALLHVLNHGSFKALLFFGAGTVIHATGTRELERFGGLSRKLPVTAVCFLIGAAAISGLPPLNGFISEFAIYFGMVEAQFLKVGMTGIALGFGVPVLAMVGALALACFVKVYAVIFLGEPRHDCAKSAEEGHWSMRLPQLVLAGACVVIGLLPGPALRALAAATRLLAGPVAAVGTKAVLLPDLVVLGRIHLGLFIGLVLLFFWATRARVAAAQKPTWDCGYAAPTARMQYTASSIASDLIDLFASALRPRTEGGKVEGFWPMRSHFTSHVPEVVLELFILPTMRTTGRAIGWLRHRKRGTAHAYVLSILLTLIAMLTVWR